jgi:hypothetical protein
LGVLLVSAESSAFSLKKGLGDYLGRKGENNLNNQAGLSIHWLPHLPARAQMIS